MECPKCHFDHPQQTTECLKCGVIFSKYLAFQQSGTAAAPAPALQVASADEPQAASIDPEMLRFARQEFLCRAFALPAALVFGWIFSLTMPAIAAFLAMWPHEFGHAVAAWFCGFNAVPTAWYTVIGERVRWISVAMAGGAAAGAYYAFRARRWFWVAVCALVIVLFIAGNSQTDFRARMLFTFWGAGGAYVLSTALMLTFYARPDNEIYQNQVRWGLLVLGAIAFCFVYREWAGGFENVANSLEDTDERGPSDPMMLTTMYGWTIYQMIHRYWLVGRLCLLALAIAYVAGLVQAHRLKTAAAE